MDTLERKSQLIAQGALHRAEIVFARRAVTAKLRPQALATGALQRLGGGALAAAISRAGALGSSGAPRNFLALLALFAPVLMRGVSILRKPASGRKSTRVTPAVIAAAVVAAAGLAIVIRKRRAARRS